MPPLLSGGFPPGILLADGQLKLLADCRLTVAADYFSQELTYVP